MRQLHVLVIAAGLSAVPLVCAHAAANVGVEASRAVQLVAHGDYDAARATLSKAVAGRKDAPLHLLQLEGLILRREGRTREAIDLFRFILSREPNFTPARIELSRALAETGDADAALHQLQVIELGSSDPEVRRQARAYGERVKSERPYGFSGYVSFLPSTNVNKGSGKTTFKVGNMEFQIDDDSREKSGVGVGAGGDAFRTFYLDQSTRLTWSGAVDLKKYSASEDFDELALSTNLSLARRFGRLELQAGPAIDYRFVAWEPYAFRYGVAAGATFDLAAHTRLYSGGTYLRQDYMSASYRNGWTFLGYAGLRHAFSPATAASLTVNYTAERTQRDYLDHDDWRLSAQVDHEWQGGLITSVAAGVGVHDYRGDFPGTTIARRDNVWSAGLTVLNRNWSFNGFAPQLKYEYTRQESNVSFYDYDSHDVDLTFTKRF
jgi:hypothetical protein